MCPLPHFQIRSGATIALLACVRFYLSVCLSFCPLVRLFVTRAVTREIKTITTNKKKTKNTRKNRKLADRVGLRVPGNVSLTQLRCDARHQTLPNQNR